MVLQVGLFFCVLRGRHSFGQHFQEQLMRAKGIQFAFRSNLGVREVLGIRLLFVDRWVSSKVTL